MSYLEIKLHTPQEFSDLLVAELSQIGYDSFMETDEGLNAYIEVSLFSEDSIKEILNKYQIGSTYSIGKLEEKNWNEEWEKNFEPVKIAGKCLVRASFHPADPSFPFEIIINPKMSFGTGHHETTAMMIEHQLETDHQGKTVLDAGSGTGVLAIMASKLGCKEVLAYDIEDWAFENLKENSNLNVCRNIKTAKGTIHQLNLPSESFDIVLANINRNILLEEIPSYSRVLKDGGVLILSGFYEEDIKDLENAAADSSLKPESVKTKNRWASLVFKKTKQVL